MTDYLPSADDAKDAAQRLAAKQLLKLTQDPLVALLARHIDPGSTDPVLRAKIAAFLGTDLGGALIAAFVSIGIEMLPGNNAHAKGMASELRKKSMTDVGDVVADLLMGPLRTVIVGMIQGDPLPGLPAATANVRVPTLVEEEESAAQPTSHLVNR